MAIIVEIKSRKNCCRKNVLTEQDKSFLSGLGDFFTGMIAGEGNAFSKAIATEIQQAVVEKILDEIFDIEANPNVKATLIYKTFTRTLANVDLKDIMKLFGNEKSSFCQTIAVNLVKSVADTVTDEITDEIEFFFDKRTGNFTGILGKLAPALRKVSGAAGEVGDFLEKMSTEQMKEDGSLDEIANAICEIDFLGLVKQVPGVGQAISLFSE